VSSCVLVPQVVGMLQCTWTVTLGRYVGRYLGPYLGHDLGPLVQAPDRRALRFPVPKSEPDETQRLPLRISLSK